MANNSTALSQFPQQGTAYANDWLIVYSPTSNLDTRIQVANIFSNLTLYVGNVYVNSTVSFGNATQNLIINSTGITINGTPFSGGGSGSGGPYGTNNQIAFNLSGTESGDANLNWNYGTATLIVGNSSVKASINSTTFTGTSLLANSAAFVGAVSAANVVSNAQLAANLSGYIAVGALASDVAPLSVNNSTNFAGQGQGFYANATNPFFSISTQVGTVSNSVMANTTAISIGNSTVNSTINSTFYSGQSNTALTANNATNLGGLVAASYANTSTPVITTTVEVGGVSNNTTLNTTAFSVGNSTVNASVNSTIYTGQALTSNNSTNFAGQGQAYYANVTAPIISTSLEVGGVSNNITTNTTAISIGNSSVVATVNSTIYTGTANNATNLGGVAAASYQTIAGLAGNVVPLTVNNATNFAGQGQAYYANVTAPVITTTLEVGASGNNVTLNTTSISVGNSTVNASVNSTIYSGTANNANNFAGQVLTYFANVTAPVLTTSLAVGSNVLVNTSTASIGNSTVNTTVNSTVYVSGNSTVHLTANSTNQSWVDIASVGNVSINSTVVFIGNSSVSATVNSTVYSGSVTNALQLGGVAAASYQTIAGLASNVATLGYQTTAGLAANVATLGYQTSAGLAGNVALLTANNSTNFAGQGQAYYANVTAPVLTTSLEIGDSTNNVTANTTQISFGNSTVNGSINSTIYTGQSNNALFIGGLPAANVVSNAQLEGNLSSYANLSSPVFTTSIQVTDGINSVTSNTTDILIGNSTVNASINSTIYTGTVNNALYIGGLIAANVVSNAQLIANLAGYANVSAPVITTTLEVGTSGNNVTLNTTAISIGNSSTNAIVNSSTLLISNVEVGALAVNGSLGIFGQFLTSGGGSSNTYWSTISILGGPFGSNTQLAYNRSGTESGDANLTWNYSSAILGIGSGTANVNINSTSVSLVNTTSNAIINSGVIFLGNSTVNAIINSTIYSGQSLTSNNATNFAGQGQAFYANVSAPVFTTTIEVGGVANNVTVNTTVISLGNSSVNASINSTYFTGITATSNNTTYLNNQLASYYTNATNISTGTLAWAQAPAGTVNTSGNFTITGVQTHTANLNVNGAIIANGGSGGAGQLLTSSGGGNVYWSTVTSGSGGGPYGANTTIAYNASGSETGDANLTWAYTTSVLNIGGGVQINTTAVIVGNSTVNNSINSTTYSGTANNATNLGGLVFSSYANNSTPIISTTLEVGAVGNNVTVNTTAIAIGNSTVNNSINSTTYSGVANNATNFAGQGQAYYANVTAPIFTANISIGSNATINTSTILMGNSTVNTTINSSAVFIGNSNIVLMIMPQQFLMMGA